MDSSSLSLSSSLSNVVRGTLYILTTGYEGRREGGKEVGKEGEGGKEGGREGKKGGREGRREGGKERKERKERKEGEIYTLEMVTRTYS